MEFLKEALGEELYAQVAEKLQGSKIKLADLSGGNYVSREKFDTTITELTEQRKTVEAALKKFDGVDVEAYKTQITELQAKMTEQQAAFETAQTQRDYADAVKDQAAAVKFSSNAAKKAYISDLISKKLPLQDGKLLGYEDYHKAYAESDPGAFSAGMEGVPIGGGIFQPDRQVQQPNPFKKGADYNLTKQGQLIRDNPQQAKSLAMQAGVKLNF